MFLNEIPYMLHFSNVTERAELCPFMEDINPLFVFELRIHNIENKPIILVTRNQYCKASSGSRNRVTKANLLY
jgi:hypothetical protein